MHPVFYISYIQPHLGPAPPLPPAPLPLDDATAGKYEVEDILNSYIVYYGPDYFVKWLGYPVFEFMWELASQLANAPNILH